MDDIKIPSVKAIYNAYLAEYNNNFPPLDRYTMASFELPTTFKLPPAPPTRDTSMEFVILIPNSKEHFNRATSKAVAQQQQQKQKQRQQQQQKQQQQQQKQQQQQQ